MTGCHVERSVAKSKHPQVQRTCLYKGDSSTALGMTAKYKGIPRRLTPQKRCVFLRGPRIARNDSEIQGDSSTSLGMTVGDTRGFLDALPHKNTAYFCGDPESLPHKKFFLRGPLYRSDTADSVYRDARTRGFLDFARNDKGDNSTHFYFEICV